MVTSDRLIKIYQNIKTLLESDNFNITDYKDISYGIQFSVSFSNWSGTIRIYQNKNGIIRNDYSQLKNGEYASKIRAIIEQREIIEQSEVIIYRVQKVKNIIRRHHTSSEVKDSLSVGVATQVHHIFPENEFPEVPKVILYGAANH